MEDKVYVVITTYTNARTKEMKITNVTLFDNPDSAAVMKMKHDQTGNPEYKARIWIRDVLHSSADANKQ